MRTGTLSPLRVLGWIACLAAVAVGVRNFEDGGLTVDAPLYASIARRIALTGDWFSLYGGTPDLKPFVEHPHLGFWFQALALRLFGIADWSARIPGHVFYFLFLTLFFFFTRERTGQKVAIWTVLLLWAFGRFSVFFSNAFLDPGALVFGTLALFLWWDAVEKKRDATAVLSGVCLLLCFLVKGMMCLGFGPAMALLALTFRERLARSLGLFCAGAFATFLVYFLMLRSSSQPEFLRLYFDRQLFHRVATSWQWMGIFWPAYWKAILIDTNYLAPAALLGFREPKRLAFGVPALLFATFTVMYACAGLMGGQYNLTLLPWIAWLLGQQLGQWKWDPLPLVKWSAGVAIAAVFLLQYFPIRIHGALPPAAALEVRRLHSQGKVSELFVDAFPRKTHFGLANVYVWYSGLDVAYPEEGKIPEALPGRYLILLESTPGRRQAMVRGGWCGVGDYPPNSLWAACR